MAVGIFGGTFDPVHIGHLRTALELKEYLGLQRMLLIPCGYPPHRDRPLTPGTDRFAMVKLAIEGEPGLEADSREIRRSGTSYSIDTIIEVRREVGRDEPLCFCIGLDSLLTLNTWHRWREILDFAHLVVAARPGWQLPSRGEIATWMGQYLTDDPDSLLAAPAGRIFIDEMTLLPVAATELRRALANGESIRYLTPDAVIEYIRNHRLYMPSSNQPGL